ncbi:lysophospholipid acyltransferase family protein [Halocynthiibacter namhaensis]|uniref:lysophospholipid acyltransferase family protein n=1 Tax=Halocynthiibacter namhaensis TaxID=1290553 RepID=UPI00057994C8|nr:lysophospholipid acyltransferase family protein [Halocynthiibacter namhaensis]
MWHAIQWVRSLLFIIQMYIMLPIVGFGMAPFVYLKPSRAFGVIRFYCNWVRWTASWMVGLKTEIRGTVPSGAVIVASKHQSFLDILLLSSALPRIKFIFKDELRYVPVISLYARFSNSIPVKRGKRGAAIKKMVSDVKSGQQEEGQLIIFPQGTRVAAGAKKSYKVGTYVLYDQTEQAVVPVATNVGVFWKRHGIMRYPGVGVLEFLDPIAPGKPQEEMMAAMEDAIETHSDRLMREAGFTEFET